MGVFVLEALFPRHSSKNCTINSRISYISEQHHKSIYIRGQTSCFPQRIPQTVVLVERKSATSLADSGVNRKRGRGEKTPESAAHFPESLFSLPVDGKDRDQRNPENEVAETDL